MPAQPLPQREHLRRLTNVFAANPLYFVTCCTAQRRPLFVQLATVEIVLAAFRAAPKYHGWFIGRYVLMPDHVHFFARPCRDAKSLDAFMRDWKKWNARKITEKLGVAAPIWQSEFFDHVLRSAASYAEKWESVRQNPVRAGLVSSPDAWPYQGECETLVF